MPHRHVLERRLTVAASLHQVTSFFENLPLGALGALAHNLFVKRQLATIFDYREKVVAEMFGRGA